MTNRIDTIAPTNPLKAGVWQENRNDDEGSGRHQTRMVIPRSTPSCKSSYSPVQYLSSTQHTFVGKSTFLNLIFNGL